MATDPSALCSEFPSAILRLTVRLSNGNCHTGLSRGFDPSSEVVLRPDADEQARKPPVVIPPENVAWVALHRTPLEEPPPEPPADLARFTIHLDSEHTLEVRARCEDTEAALGFVAWPASTGGLYALYFVYHRGVRAVVNQERIGQVLLRDGHLRAEDLERGLEAQEQARAARIGEILTEQGAVGQEHVERAAAEQPTYRRGDRPMRLGEILVEAGLATYDQIQRALTEQKKRRGRRLGQILVEMDIVDEFHISQALARKFNLPFRDLEETGVQPAAISHVPFELVKRFGFLPIQADSERLTVAIADPLALEGIDLLRFSTRKAIHEVVVTPSQLAHHLDPHLETGPSPTTTDMHEILKQLSFVDGSHQDPHREVVVSASDRDDGVVRLINHVIVDAFHRGASDIHVEPDGPDRDTLIRARVDGECETIWRLPPAFRARIVARLKVMARLDIAEHRKPQDGKIKFRIGNRRVELRIATLPVVSGDEDVVLRLLGAGGPLPLERLGMAPADREALERASRTPHGLILAVGPTGSGKTTTLHSLLAELNDDCRKIWTAEDPVEITQPGLRQLQVNRAVGLDFANALRAFLRADPDVIMVGEIRDLETARMAVEASLTGHLVFSTLHTNSAPETVTRLVDMGIDPFLFSDALVAVVAQRLTRRLCPFCREPYVAGEEETDFVRRHLGDAQLDTLLQGRRLHLYRAKGCPQCRDRGYKGRLGIYELLVVDTALRRAIQHREPVSTLRRLLRESGTRTLREDGLVKCISGDTDLHQVNAVCGG